MGEPVESRATGRKDRGNRGLDPDARATFGNIPRDKPDLRFRRPVRLVHENGKWREVRPNGKRWTARGQYAFVVQGGHIWAVKGRNIAGVTPGHTEAARGGRVEYAGNIRFGNGANSRGVLRSWSNASGHYLPAASFAANAGLPMGKFKAYAGPPPTTGPTKQLPVFQEPPGSRLQKAPRPGKSSNVSLQRQLGRRPGQNQPITKTGRIRPGRGLLVLEGGLVLLGWAGNLIQEAGPRVVLTSLEQKIQGMLIGNPGKGVVVELTWRGSYPIGNAVGHTKPNLVFKPHETKVYLRNAKKTGIFTRKLPPNILVRKQFLWSEPLPETYPFPPEKSAVRPHSIPLPRIDYFKIRVSAKRLIAHGEKLVKKKGTKEYQAKFKRWLADKDRWNDRMLSLISRLDKKWDANDITELRGIQTWFNERASKILGEGSNVKIKSTGRWLIVHGRPNVKVFAGTSVIVTPGGFTAPDGTVFVSVSVPEIGEKGHIQKVFLTSH